MGKVEGGMKCVKYLLFVFNFIFWLMGSFVLAVGLWLRFDPETVSLLSGEKAPDTFFIGEHHSAPSSLQPMGSHGCAPPFNRSICPDGNKEEEGRNIWTIKESYIMQMESLLFFNAPYNIPRLLIFFSHFKLSCCGTIENRCPDAEKDTRVRPRAARYNHLVFYETSPLQDCETGIKDFFNSKLFIVGYVGIGIAGVMIIGMIFSMVLCCAIRNSREVI
uniref:Tetraspanin 2b n=1 Tax=Neolamprologus brichardi TaxID=32507 RepID=A0A3Q4HWI7_NEOBR